MAWVEVWLGKIEDNLFTSAIQNATVEHHLTVDLSFKSLDLLKHKYFFFNIFPKAKARDL